MFNYRLDTLAYAKIALHAYRCPHLAVNGVLLAKRDSAKDGALAITDAVPLFHGVLNLNAMLEVALQQVDLYAERQDMQIVGYYVIHETDDAGVDAASSKIADTIAENYGKACLLLVKNASIAVTSQKPAFDTYIKTDGRWKVSGDASTSCENGAHDALKTLVLKRTPIASLVDFDDHLDNVARDWTNAWIAKEIRHN
eukprot:Opistho-2@95339